MNALRALGDRIERPELLSTLAASDVELEDVAPFVEESPDAYTRRLVARTDAFELLVMTWRPGQSSVPHDHGGSLCALRILRGRARESLFEPACDGRVARYASATVSGGEVLVDSSDHVHALANDREAGEALVTLHVYAPPLPELRRFALRRGSTLGGAFARSRAAATPTIAIVGGGFSGTLVAANLIRTASATGAQLHVVLLDRQAAFGEGAAYRTADPQHLLNVPAAGMSAWPDRPSDFLEWQRTRVPDARPYDFVPRRLYGEYVRGCLDGAAHAAPASISAEVRRVEVLEARAGASGEGFTLQLDDGRSLDARCVVLATGHRPPDDPLASCWIGPRSRFVADPWASLALGAIQPDEPVVLLGTGLTAVDVLLTILRRPRSAPILAISRRGLRPHAHAEAPIPREDPSGWLEPLLARPGGPTTRELLRALRDAAARSADWRGIVDGLRPHTAQLWRSLAPREASRFLRHARPFWEVHRHRVAPSVGERLGRHIDRGEVQMVAARVLSASADREGVTLAIRRRGAESAETLRTAWIVNCTGPASAATLREVPLLRSLLEAGLLARDEHDLGVRTDDEGRAVTREGGARDDLLVVGTLRKPQLWESTAVPELRAQAAEVARVALASLARP